jgi:AcrR family transcriptional regulator
MAPHTDKVRRPGYAPAANAGVGRRGLHTRERILTSAAEVFLANGFHSTSLDTIARAAKASRATVYQYFAGKEAIFGELTAAAERDVLDHGDRLDGLAPTAAGVDALHRWLLEWADIYDCHAAAFAEYPGIGTELGIVGVGTVAETFGQKVNAQMRDADLHGLDAPDAAAALMRIPHMVHLYRHRAMFPLPDRAAMSWSLTVVLQLMLFPDTPVDALRAVRPPDVDAAGTPTVPERPEPLPAVDAVPPSPISLDVLTVSSKLFAERGYYAVGMEEIAAAADVSRATLYRYFSTKVEILAELTRRAVVEVEAQAAALPTAARTGSWSDWLLGYVRFHRTYSGVIRAWFDGTVAEHLSGAEMDHGISAIHRAVGALLADADLPADIDVEVAGAVFLAVLGRMTEPTTPGDPESDERAAALMENLLRRSLLQST